MLRHFLRLPFNLQGPFMFCLLLPDQNPKAGIFWQGARYITPKWERPTVPHFNIQPTAWGWVQWPNQVLAWVNRNLHLPFFHGQNRCIFKIPEIQMDSGLLPCLLWDVPYCIPRVRLEFIPKTCPPSSSLRNVWGCSLALFHLPSDLSLLPY